jgi:hypothetical protein
MILYAECNFQTYKFDFYMLECDFYTQCTISNHKVWFPLTRYQFDTYACEYDTHEFDNGTHEYDTYTQSVISTRSLISTGMNVISTGTSVISTRTRLIFTRRIRSPHAE